VWWSFLPKGRKKPGKKLFPKEIIYRKRKKPGGGLKIRNK